MKKVQNSIDRMIESILETKIDKFNVIERTYSNEDKNLSIGLANIHADVPNVERNKENIVQAIKIFKDKGVNMAIFPEFCLAGYFWDTTPSKGIDNKEQNSVPDCWEYMDSAVIEEHTDWMKNELEPLLDDTLQFIIFNNIRKGPDKKYLNSTYIVNKGLDYLNPKWIYDKTFLPGIEKTYTETGQRDRLILDTKWGKFGFTSCYDFCFPQLLQEYSQVDKVDAVIEIASWRGTAERDYPGMNVSTDTYYGDLWDMFMMSRAATNQVWVISSNAVGVHAISEAVFWGGSGLWAPSGMKLLQASHANEELLIIHNVDIKGQKEFEKDDFDYSLDFNKIYKPISGKRAFTRIKL